MTVDDNTHDGPDCGNICDVVYFTLCFECVAEHVCHNNGIDHDKLLDCALKHLKDGRKNRE